MDYNATEGFSIELSDQLRGLRLVAAGLNKDADAANAVFAEIQDDHRIVALALCCADIAARTINQTVGTEQGIEYLLNDIRVLLDADDGDDE